MDRTGRLFFNSLLGAWAAETQTAAVLPFWASSVTFFGSWNHDGPSKCHAPRLKTASPRLLGFHPQVPGVWLEPDPWGVAGRFTAVRRACSGAWRRQVRGWDLRDSVVAKLRKPSQVASPREFLRLSTEAVDNSVDDALTRPRKAHAAALPDALRRFSSPEKCFRDQYVAFGAKIGETSRDKCGVWA